MSGALPQRCSPTEAIAGTWLCTRSIPTLHLVVMEVLDRLTGDLHPQLQVVAGDVAVRLLLQERLYLWRHSAATGVAVETNHNIYGRTLFYISSQILYTACLRPKGQLHAGESALKKSEKNASPLTSSMKAMPGLCSGRYTACSPAAAAAACTSCGAERKNILVLEVGTGLL